jgi:CheY-like chemotaxis protein
MCGHAPKNQGSELCAGPADILVVDDNPDVRELLCIVLELDGYRVLAAEGGRDALELLTRIVPPALILLDLMMPDMDGLQVVAALQADAALASIPVVFVSGSTEAIATGARFLRKPVQCDDLIRAVREFCVPSASPSHPS